MAELTLEFSDAATWRKWLEEHHGSDDVVWLVIYKRSTGKDTLDYQQALDEAICFGWIDSRLRRIDDEKHVIRFTKRKAGKAWSLVNLRKAKNLIAKGRMTQAGMALLPKDIEAEMQKVEEMDRNELVPPRELEEALRKEGLMETFLSLSPSHRRAYNRWIAQAKRSGTRDERISMALKLIAKREMPMSMTKWKMP